MRTRRRARSRAGFTLLEALVGLSLGAILVGVAAVAYQRMSALQQRTLDRALVRRQVAPLLEPFLRDGRRVVALDGVEPCLRLTRGDSPDAGADGDGEETARTDELSCLVLAEDPPRLLRVRYRVAEWDADRGRGALVREETPLTAGELPIPWQLLAAPSASSSVTRLGPVTRFRARWPDDGEGFADPPPDGRELRRVIEGRDGFVIHRQLRAPADFAPLQGGVLAWLQHDVVGRPSFPEGYYPAQAGADEALLLQRSVGSARSVAFRAAWLPAQLHVEVGVQEGSEEARGRRAIPLRPPHERLIHVRDRLEDVRALPPPPPGELVPPPGGTGGPSGGDR